MMALRDFEAFLATPGAKTDAEVVAAMNANGVTAADVARIVGAPVEEVAARVGAVQEANFLDFLMAPNLSDAQIVAEMNRYGITPERGSAITGVPVEEVQSRYNSGGRNANCVEALQTPGLYGCPDCPSHQRNRCKCPASVECHWCALWTKWQPGLRL
jgi:hypothetical protein